MTLDDLHVSRSLRRRIQRSSFQVSWNREFDRVMRRCGEDRPEGTWIFSGMIEAYLRLHHLGHAHSLEVWMGRELVGGVYGVQVGGLFAAESMFNSVPDASKVALVTCLREVWGAGIELFDVQFLSPHLATMGARTCSREEYLRLLDAVRDKAVDLSRLEPNPERQ
jgi:leucyl/phenylalanyl-tRNA--protein transferase